MREYFTEIVGAQTTEHMKPHPEPLLYAAAAMGVAPHDCLMIGDTTIDIRTGADLVLRTTSDLLAVLRPAEDSLKKTASPEPAKKP